MTYCRNCGAALEENASFCSKCGTPVTLAAVERAAPSGRERRPMRPWVIAAIIALVAIVAVAALAIPLLLGGVLPFSRVVGSGNVTTQEKNFTDFTVIDADSGFRVQITQASSYSIVISADNNLFSYIQVTKTGNTLTIRLQPGLSFQVTTLRAEISMPDLDGLKFSGGVIGTATNEFVLSHNFQVELSGGSTFRVSGQAKDLVAVASGGSSLNLSDFAVNNADIEFSGGSQGTINLNGTLDANLSGGSRLYYIGSPTLGNINTSGGSSISPA